MWYSGRMIFRHEHAGGVWVDLEQPTEDDVRRVANEFSIGERIVKEVLSPTPSPLITRDAGIALLVLHFPVHGAEDGDMKNQEVDFIVGNNFIVTVRYEVIVPLHHLKKLLEAQEVIADRVPINTEILLEILFAHLYTSVRDRISHVANRLEVIEREMFTGRERATVRLISSVSREFLHMESALANHEGPLNRFLKLLEQGDFFGGSFTERAERICSERSQVAQLVKTHRAITAELRETNISMLEVRQNEIMKTLTTVNFIFLPLGLISWTFAMRTEGMPLIDSPNAFWIVLALMFVVAMLMIVFFVRRRWLF